MNGDGEPGKQSEDRESRPSPDIAAERGLRYQEEMDDALRRGLMLTCSYGMLIIALLVAIDLIGLSLAADSAAVYRTSVSRAIMIGWLALVREGMRRWPPGGRWLAAADAAVYLALVIDVVNIVAVRGLTHDVSWASVALIVMARGLLVPGGMARTVIMLLAIWSTYSLGLVALMPASTWEQRGIVRLVVQQNAVIFATVVISLAGARFILDLRLREFRARSFGSYRIITEVSRGGAGVVYRAMHSSLKKVCAVKVLAAGDLNRTDAKRFEQEAVEASQLDHPNVVTIYDYGRTAEGQPYYAMELLSGMNLAELHKANGGPLPAARVIHLMLQACSALSAAHARGLVHRDIKPENLFITQVGEDRDFLKVLDFGLVKILREEEPLSNLTEDGSLAGTPHYMAPEQCRGQAVSELTDVYALGAVMYLLLTGKPVFDHPTSRLSIIMKHVRAPPTPPSKLEANVAEDIEHVVMQCLEKRASDRPQSAAALGGALRGCRDFGGWRPDMAAAWWNTFEGTQSHHTA